MSFCSNCGKELALQIKFCPSCGTKIIATEAKQYLKGYQEKMYKNTAISLQRTATKIVQNATKESFSTVAKNIKNALDSSQSTSEIFKPKPANTTKATTQKTAQLNSTWTWIYLILNGLLVYIGHQSDEAIGVLLFSVLILLLVFFRRNAAKPYNWFVKIILVIQLIFLIALIADGLEYVAITTLLYMAILFANFMLIIKGNKS
jgi:DNA-directed RNA polymerase subunit RPC12/RpoP